MSVIVKMQEEGRPSRSFSLEQPNGVKYLVTLQGYTSCCRLSLRVHNEQGMDSTLGVTHDAKMTLIPGVTVKAIKNSEGYIAVEIEAPSHIKIKA